MLAIVVSMVKTRLGLLAVEARLELNRIWPLLALTVLALIFVAMALLMLSLLVIIAYGETSRLLAIGCLLGLYVAAAIYIAFFMWWLGNYSLVKAIPIGVAIPIVLFWVFEIAFLISAAGAIVAALFLLLIPGRGREPAPEMRPQAAITA